MLQDPEINLHIVGQSYEKVKHWGSDCLKGYTWADHLIPGLIFL